MKNNTQDMRLVHNLIMKAEKLSEGIKLVTAVFETFCNFYLHLAILQLSSLYFVSHLWAGFGDKVKENQEEDSDEYDDEGDEEQEYSPMTK